jgi:peptidoglycan hydrolase-like protein with peptidoglycan-binding domain
MNKLILAVFVTLVFCVGTFAQAPSSTQTAKTASVSDDKPKKQIFRANKEQIMEVQKMLKAKNLYSGESTGKLDADTRTAIKAYQKDNGLKKTGTLNRATLEKMGIALTDSQKLIPASPNSYAVAETRSSGPSAPAEPKTKRVIFRATKDQIVEAQRTLKAKGLYTGDESGKLDDATRDGLKKYQEANGVKVTGTLNQVTLEKMGIELTEKQKADSAEGNK